MECVAEIDLSAGTHDFSIHLTTAVLNSGCRYRSYLNLAYFYCSPHQYIRRAPSFHVLTWNKTQLVITVHFREVLYCLLLHLTLPLQRSNIHLMASSFENQCGNNYSYMKTSSTCSCNILFILCFYGGWWLGNSRIQISKAILHCKLTKGKARRKAP